MEPGDEGRVSSAGLRGQEQQEGEALRGANQAIILSRAREKSGCPQGSFLQNCQFYALLAQQN